MIITMMKARNSFRSPIFLLVAALLIQWALLMSIRAPNWDATFYYAYARSIAFDGDLKIDNDLRLSYPTNPTGFVEKRYDEVLTETGRVASPFAIGSSLLWLPWLFLMRGFAGLAQLLGLTSGNMTGFEWFFISALATLSMFLGWIAFYVSYRIALVETRLFSALAATITLLFATPLLYYMYRESLYSHAASAFIIALVVFVWWRGLASLPSLGQGLLLGALIGLAGLIRWQHLVYLILPIISTIWWWWSLPGRQRRDKWSQAVIFLALVGLSALAVFSIQLAHWRLLYGAWLTVPQGSAYVDWRAPFWQPLLVSTFRGILPWMPVALLSVIGLILLGRRRIGLVVPLILVLLLETYVNSSTRDWFAGAGFGPRRYSSELVILILGYAALLEAIPDRIRKPLAVVAGVVLGLHQWILLRYGLSEKIGGSNVTMYPTYKWIEDGYGAFGRQIVNHLPDIIRSPLDFFALSGSPLNEVGQGQWPLRHLIALAAIGFVLLLIWRLVRSPKAQAIVSQLSYPGLIIVAVVALAIVDLWILILA